jgi:DNA-binding ferritin-like protein (Dps family)
MERFTLRLDEVDSITLKSIALETRDTPSDIFRKFLRDYRDMKSRQYVKPEDFEKLSKQVDKQVNELDTFAGKTIAKVKELDKRIFDLSENNGVDSSKEFANVSANHEALAAKHEALSKSYATMRIAFDVMFKELGNQPGSSQKHRDEYYMLSQKIGIPLS